MDLQFLGAAGTVTGSSFLLDGKIMVDMGMFQGGEAIEALNYRGINFDVSKLTTVFLTHAHLDHVGRMPILMKHGFRGKIYMTKATKEISEVVLYDAAKIMQNDDEKPILYTEADVLNLLNQAQTVSYGEEVRLENLSAIFRDAGHILGSASIEMHFYSENTKVVFSGDLGNSPQELVRPTEYVESADAVVMESTYGDRNHPDENPEKVLAHEIALVEQEPGTLIIPSFSVERTQVLLYLIGNLKKEGRVKAETPIYLDSPMGEKVTRIYKSYSNLFNQKLQEELKSGNPFNFSGLRVVKGHRESLDIHDDNGPKVIIAGSGMMTGGRVLEHAIYYLPKPTTRLLIAGFQAEETLGREIEDGAKVVNIFGEEVSVAANVNSLHSLSSHADQRKLLKWIQEIKGVSKAFLVHGEDTVRNVLRERIKESGISEVYTPNLDAILKI